MQRRVPVQTLRGSDATLLEVQLQNLLRRPMGQLAPENVLDLLALAEAEGRPRSVGKQLEQFVERCGNELADMPPPAFTEFLDEVQPIDADRVPLTFRLWLEREAARTGRDTARIEGWLEELNAVEPTPFALGEVKAKVEHGHAAARRDIPTARVKGGRGLQPAGRSSTPRTRSPSAPRIDVGGGPSPDKLRVIEKICMERLNGATDKGLAEAVLIAGVRHRAKTEGYEDVTPAEVTSALRGLKTADRVRTSAGRWMSTVRRW